MLSSLKFSSEDKGMLSSISPSLALRYFLLIEGPKIPDNEKILSAPTKCRNANVWEVFRMESINGCLSSYTLVNWELPPPLTHCGARYTHTTTPFSKCRSLRLARLPILNSSAKRQYCVQPAKILAREIATLPRSFVQRAVHIWVKCITFYSQNSSIMHYLELTKGKILPMESYFTLNNFAVSPAENLRHLIQQVVFTSEVRGIGSLLHQFGMLSSLKFCSEDKGMLSSISPSLELRSSFDRRT
ncbi:hypothetical protein CEXT_521391 [Caerostris extrusa]|uniref:Uncharacterized protein n=1 Tax=Caerostris extrusa TaxID=172846 RepID=A0AAV4V517_CAEEX|nr:hypothetical protein CEXT_521391 [Caerostris extrusa]